MSSQRGLCISLLALLTIGCVDEAADVDAEADATALLRCLCGDGVTRSICESAACGEIDASRCVDACDGRGVSRFECFDHQLACVVGDDRGENALVCPCAGALEDAAVCFDGDCADVDVDAACAIACDGALDAAPRCGPDDRCLSDGVPDGRDAVRCRCDDGTFERVCGAGLLASPVLRGLCDDVCGGANLDGHERKQAACALDGNAGGVNLVDCGCGDRGRYFCSDVDCDADADAVVDACVAECGDSAAPRCEIDNLGCASAGQPSGPTLLGCFCQSPDLTRQGRVDACVPGCDIDGGCPAVCRAGGFDLSGFVDECVDVDLGCALGERGHGGDGDTGVVCDCGDRRAGVCADLDCAADGADVAAVCGAVCNGVVVSAGCVDTDAGCVVRDLPTGASEVTCRCVGDVDVAFCAETDCGLELVAPCTAACDGAGLSEFFCVTSGACAG